MTQQRDAVLATLKHELVDFVPGFCFFATPQELRDHLDKVYRVGCPGGGFIPMEAGGVPKNMSRENFKFYLQYRRELSCRHNIQS